MKTIKSVRMTEAERIAIERHYGDKIVVEVDENGKETGNIFLFPSSLLSMRFLDFTLPELTSVQRNALESPNRGQLIYNSTTDSVQYYSLSGWKDLMSS